MTYEFFDKDRMLFGSDAPMEKSNGEIFTLEA
jgi:predicted TIM-barrel fold metal-dependent hydrolase